MTILFQQIVLTVIIVLGMKIAMSEGMLLEKLGRYFEQKIDEGYKIFDLFYCQWCGGTFYGIVAYFFAFGLGLLPFEWDWQLLIRWPLITMGSSIIAGNLWNIYLTINSIREKHETEHEYLKSLMYEEDSYSEN